MLLRKVALAALALAACALPARTASAQDDGLEAALRKLHADDGGEIRYFVGRVDLDGDGAEDAVAHVAGPLVCGSGGCPTHVFRREGQGYRLVSTVSVSRPPVVASERRTRGWRNLYVLVAGGGVTKGYYAELRFDGRRYPRNPTVRPAVRTRGTPPGTVLVKEFENFTEGTPLRAGSFAEGVCGR